MDHTTISQAIRQRREQLAEAIYSYQRDIQPDLRERYNATSHEKSLRDTGYHLAYLEEAIGAARPALFADYIAWAGTMLEGYGVPARDLRTNLECIQHVLQAELPAAMHPVIEEFLAVGLAHLPGQPAASESFVAKDAPHGVLASQYLRALLDGDRQQASRLIMEAVARGASVKDIYLHVFQPCQYEIGRLWQTNQISVAHEHFATAVTQLVMSQLYPHIFSSTRRGHTLVATCVGQELHEIGVRMVADFFEMDGWDTFYLGGNTPIESTIRMIKERAADVLAISTTMTLHISAVAQHIEQVRQASDVRILVGGYPFNVSQDLWQQVGADGYAPNAQDAIALAHDLVN